MGDFVGITPTWICGASRLQFGVRPTTFPPVVDTDLRSAIDVTAQSEPQASGGDIPPPSGRSQKELTMKMHLVALCATALVLPGAASAQSTNSTANPATKSSDSMPAKGTADDRQASADNLLTTRKLTQDLQNAGFTDVKVVAQAYVVQAKTKDGNPVVMTLGPHGFSAFEAVDATGSTGKAAQGDRHALAVSRLKDMNLYNANGDMLGDVEHVMSDGQGRNSIVIGKGGFLGLGEKQVAIPLNNVVMRGDRLVTHDLSDEQIKAMPEWKKGQQQTELDSGKTVQIRSAG